MSNTFIKVHCKQDTSTGQLQFGMTHSSLVPGVTSTSQRCGGLAMPRRGHRTDPDRGIPCIQRDEHPTPGPQYSRRPGRAWPRASALATVKRPPPLVHSIGTAWHGPSTPATHGVTDNITGIAIGRADHRGWHHSAKTRHRSIGIQGRTTRANVDTIAIAS